VVHALMLTGVDARFRGYRLPMPSRILKGHTSAVRHAGWWLAWHSRPLSGSGCRELDESSLACEEPQCASSS
jgi:hypothetical protein